MDELEFVAFLWRFFRVSGGILATNSYAARTDGYGFDFSTSNIFDSHFISAFDNQQKFKFFKTIFYSDVSGVFISAFYALQSHSWGYQSAEWGSWPQFFGFLKSYRWVAFAAFVWAVFCHRRAQTWQFGCAIAVLGQFAAGPAIFALSRSRGMFFNDRHYIYWVSSTVIVFVGLAIVVKEYWRMSRWKYLQRPEIWLTLLLMAACVDRLNPRWGLSEFNGFIGRPFTLFK